MPRSVPEKEGGGESPYTISEATAITDRTTAGAKAGSRFETLTERVRGEIRRHCVLGGRELGYLLRVKQEGAPTGDWQLT